MLDLEKLEKNLTAALEAETEESLLVWLKNVRQRNTLVSDDSK